MRPDSMTSATTAGQRPAPGRPRFEGGIGPGALTRGRRLDRKGFAAFIKQLAIPQDAKRRLLALTPASYTGLAAELAKRA